VPPATDSRDLAYDRDAARAFGRFSSGWWQGTTARQAWFLTLSLATLIVLNIGINVAVNRWNREFFDALERRDAGTLGLAVLVFAGLLVVIAAIGVAIVLTRETLQVRWREWLVGRLIGVWLDRKRYYRLALARAEPANPEYRIADDSRMATEPVVDFAIGLLNALLTALAFVSILWTVGGSLTVSVAGTAITIPAYIMLAAILYGVCASWLMLKVGRPLVPGVARKNEAEAKLRFELTRLRENAESIALIRGERDEKAILSDTYGTLVKRWLTVVGLHGRLTWITNASGALVPVLPLLLATPKYLSGELSLGAVTQLAAAFFQVQIAIAWLVDNYKAVAQWYASARRVMVLVEAIDDLEADVESRHEGGIALVPSRHDAVELRGLAIAERSGRALVAPLSLTIEPGEKVLVMGESGIGKSTLVRAIAGLWPWGRGEVALPADAALAFVPQRPYLPLGTLRQALLYPLVDLPITDDALASTLRECGLGGLVARLDEVERWDQMLSSGERQRLAFARLILQRPDIAILDEATSALDEAGQERLMELIRRALPDTTIIAIGHRAGLEAYHDRVFRLVRAPDGAQLESVRGNEPMRLRA
jgi:vitamin B12/bleomycin/antimicrobial peptide transport system ATP-binding/permease protein